MADAPNSVAMWKKRVLAELQRDKKKAIILGALLLVAVVLVGKLLLKSSPEPATAGRPAPEAPTEPPGTNTDEAPRERVNRIPGSRTDRPVIPDNLADTITRDIFKPDEQSFPPVKPAKTNVVKTKTGNPIDIEKETKGKRIQAESAQLHLENTITGSKPMAIINGTVLSRDGLIAGFRVVEIGLRSCVVEKEGVRVELTMDK